MKKYTYAFLMILAMTVTHVLAQVQSDNPKYDQVPQYLRERASIQGDAPLSSMISVGNWDNFSLGVDFAENNMTANPNIPTWFFTAYNTNGTHHTENGIDWAVNNPNFGVTVNGDPVVAYDSIGNLFYENMYGSITGCKVVSSANNGVTWGPSVTAIAGVDKNWMACDQTSGPYANSVYTVMTGNVGGNFARSTDHGATFATTFSPATQSLPGMMVCVGPQGNVQGGAVYVVTNSGSAFASVYTFYRSNDGGTTFTQQSAQQWTNTVGTQVGGRNSVSNMRTRPYPMIAADNSYGTSRGKLYTIYASNDPPGNGNKSDVFCRSSSDGGVTWSSAVKVNDDVNTQDFQQWHPATWCDKETGRLYVMWMDTRDTPTNDSAYIYASYSTDGGATFVPNQRISNAKMKINCTTCAGGGTPRYQGDYNGVVSNSKVSMIGWTDFRAGNFQSMTAYFPDFAMAIDHASDTLTAFHNAVFQVSIPEIKLYTDQVNLSASISPVPATGSISLEYPLGNTISTYPASRPVKLVLSGDVPAGDYTVTFVAAGPNGTPVHRRTATVTVLSSCYLVNAFPYTESFDGATFAPSCWANVNTAGPGLPGTWDQQTAGLYPTCTPHSGTSMARFDSYNYPAGTSGNLVLPRLTMPSDRYEIHFWMYRDDGYAGVADRVNVYYNTLPNTSGATLLGTVNRHYQLSPNAALANQWYEYVFSMPAGTSGNAFIIIEGLSQWGNSIYLDDVSVTSSCKVEAFPFMESFDAETFTPACWTNLKTSGISLPGTWDRQTAGTNPACSPHSGAAMARFNSWNYYIGNKGILVTPLVSLPSDQFEVRFWMYRDAGLWDGNPDLVNVYMNTSPNTAGGVLLGTVHRSHILPPVAPAADQWYEYVFKVPAGSSGNSYFVFEGVSQFGTSIFIDDVKVKPSCMADTFPFAESFDGPAFSPACWSNIKTAGASTPGTWDRQTVGTNPACLPHSGAAMARYDSWDYFTGTKGILVTPQVYFPSDQYSVRFWMYRDAGSWNTIADLVNVYYNTSQGTAGAKLLGTIHRSYALTPAAAIANQWYEYEFKIPSGSAGNAYIVFEGVSQYGTSIFVDDIKIAPSCATPANVSLVMLTATVVTISWPAPSPVPAAGYSYEIRTSGLPGSGTTGLAASGITAAGVLSATIYGLNPGTSYSAYVRSSCDADNFSFWSAPKPFTTPDIGVNTNVLGTVSTEQSLCYDALQTITVAGPGAPFIINTGGSVEMIAGFKILYQPGTQVHAGGYMHGHIAPGGPFCTLAPSKMVSGEEEGEELSAMIEKSFFRIYPNPTSGIFTLEQKGERVFSDLRIEVYGLRGDRILTAEMAGEKRHEFSINSMPVGLYFVKVIAGDHVETIKLIKVN